MISRQENFVGEAQSQMDISISINPIVVVILIGVFIALRVWHPITAYAGRLKKKNTRSPF